MAGSPRLFFHCFPDKASPVGGVKQHYRQVELLNTLGFEAYVVHQRPGFRASWFPSTAPVVDLAAFLRASPDPSRDWLVLPETWVSAKPDYLRGFRKVIFNQNAYYTFGSNEAIDPHVIERYSHPDIRAVVTVSRDNQQLLQGLLTLPRSRIFSVVNGVDPALFFPAPSKHKRIAFLPRKHFDHAMAVQWIAERRPVLADYPFHPLQQLTHQQLAQQLRESLVFLNFGHPEGFGLPLAEAIASGCIVVGYHGLAGRDFCADALHEVSFGDWLGCVNQLEAAIRRYEVDPQQHMRRLKEQSAQMHARYGPEAERDQCEQVWKAVLAEV